MSHRGVIFFQKKQYKMTFSVNRKSFEYYFSCHFFAWIKKVTKKSQENPIRKRAQANPSTADFRATTPYQGT